MDGRKRSGNGNARQTGTMCAVMAMARQDKAEGGEAIHRFVSIFVKS
jgi:hypothetical protein